MDSLSASLNRFVQQNVLTELFPPDDEVEVEVEPVEAASPICQSRSRPNSSLPTGRLVAVVNQKGGVLKGLFP